MQRILYLIKLVLIFLEKMKIFPDFYTNIRTSKHDHRIHYGSCM